MRSLLPFFTVVLATLAGCSEPIASPTIPPTDDSDATETQGSLNLGPSPGQIAIVSIALPRVGDAQLGEGCQFSVEVENVHASSANFTYLLATQYLTNGTRENQPLPLQLSYLVTGDSLAGQPLSVQLLGVSLSREIWIGDLQPGSPSITVKWSGNVVASQEYFDLFGIPQVSQPVLNLVVLADEAPQQQTFQVHASWRNCEVDALVSSAESSTVVRAGDFESLVSLHAGAAWLGRELHWTGTLPNPGATQIWAVMPPQTLGQRLTAIEVQVNDRPEIPTTNLLVGVESGNPVWSLGIDSPLAESQYRIPIFIAFGMTLPEISFGDFWSNPEE